ncbi:MAG: peptidoglycan bridge formation glycyltransferase FemA/FemB family protein [Atopobiaceae bacterium]|nr:peptidoglycan bridge formation glycyltransferase FemA/FemB family protein [Atopobiaceae bacterium]
MSNTQEWSSPQGRLRQELAKRSGTNAADWFLCFKARHAMLVVFREICELYGGGEVATQLFTCCTAVNPIIAAGLTPRYYDISSDTLSLNPNQMELSERTRAVVCQHSFGIVNNKTTADLAQAAHAYHAVLMEDSAHCVGRLAQDSDGHPIADISIHSFGIEKMLPGVYFGGAIWLNPNMENAQLRQAIAARLSTLEPMDEKLGRAVQSYRNQLRMLTRLPKAASQTLKEQLTARGQHEPGLSYLELRGGVAHEPCSPNDWVCEQALSAMQNLNQNETQRMSTTEIYRQMLHNNAQINIPAAVLDADAQPLLRFPVLLPSKQAAERLNEKICELGYYTSAWYRPLLYPGVAEPAAYGLTEQGFELWPQTVDISERVVNLPTDAGDQAARRIVAAVEEITHEYVPAKKSSGGLLASTGEVRDRLQPVILGGDVLAYAYSREFDRAYGVHPIVLSAIDVQLTSSSKLCDYRIVEGFQDEEQLVPYLMSLAEELKAAGKLPLLLGSADWHVRLISKNAPELGKHYVIPYIDFDLYEEITQKERFYELCEELGIAYPKTVYLDLADPDVTLDEFAFDYPLIAKPSNSPAYDLLEFEGKKKIYEIQTPAELRQAFEAVKASGYAHKLVLQEFVPGDDDAIRSLTTFSDAQGKLQLVSGGRVILQDHAPLMLGNPVCIMLERVEPIIEGARRFLEHVGYHGYANFDIKYDSRDGSYKFFEVNARPGRNTYYVSLGGVNFVKPLVEDFVLGHELNYTEAYDSALYTMVPSYVVSKSVHDEQLKTEVLSMYKRGLAHSPEDNPADTIKHRLLAQASSMRQIQKFKRYLWDVEKERHANNTAGVAEPDLADKSAVTEPDLVDKSAVTEPDLADKSAVTEPDETSDPASGSQTDHANTFAASTPAAAPISCRTISLTELQMLAQNAGVTRPIEQTSEWAAYEQTVNGRSYWGSVAIEQGGNPCGVCALIDYETHGYHYLRSHHGPVWFDKPNETQERERLQALAEHVRNKDSKPVFARLAIAYEHDICSEVLSTVPYNETVIIDLSGTDEDILSRLKSRGRRDVRKALRESPISCADETDAAMADFSEYYAVMVETAERDGFAPAPMSDYQNMMRCLGKEHVRLYAGRDEQGRLTNWSLETISGTQAVHYYAAMRTEYMRQFVADRLIYFAFCELAKRGVTSIDLMGIGNDFAPTLKGLNTFKCKFSPDTVSVAPDRDLILKPLMYKSLTAVKNVRARVAQRGNTK